MMQIFAESIWTYSWECLPIKKDDMENCIEQQDDPFERHFFPPFTQ